jgi:hypothetical protein
VFRFLGESIHSLQVAGKVPAHVQESSLPSISWLGSISNMGDAASTAACSGLHSLGTAAAQTFQNFRYGGIITEKHIAYSHFARSRSLCERAFLIIPN